MSDLRGQVVLGGSPERVIPGHDPLLFERFPGDRVSVIVGE